MLVEPLPKALKKLLLFFGRFRLAVAEKALSDPYKPGGESYDCAADPILPDTDQSGQARKCFGRMAVAVAVCVVVVSHWWQMHRGMGGALE